MKKEFGQIAYEAYAHVLSWDTASVAWKETAWKKLDPLLQEAWDAVASAVLEEADKREMESGEPS
jgi:hypothetical protein